MRDDGKRTTLFEVLRKYKLLVFFSFILGLSLIVAGISLYPNLKRETGWPKVQANKQTAKPIEPPSQSKKDLQNGEPDQVEEERAVLPSYDVGKNGREFTVLLVGVDQRPGERSISNTDTLILAHINAETGLTTLLSVPRDTQVDIPGYGRDKINAAARRGKGITTTETVLANLVGQPIEGYVIANFAGFKEVVDTLGGITLNVEKDMYYNTGDTQDAIINLKKGEQRLNGTQTLQYARFRQDPLADIARTIRQQNVLKAMAKEFMQLKTLPKLPRLIPQIYRTIDTDLPINRLLAIAGLAVRFDSNKIVSQTLPGNFLIEKGISYWKVNLGECRQVAAKLFRQGQASEVFSVRAGTDTDTLPAAQVEKATGDSDNEKPAGEEMNKRQPLSVVNQARSNGEGRVISGKIKSVDNKGNKNNLDYQDNKDNKDNRNRENKDITDSRSEKLDKKSIEDGIIVEFEPLSSSESLGRK